MPLFHIILILITGIAAGFLNTVGGGGSLLTMPMLIFLGLGSAMANGTNRVAVMVQNIVATINFRRKGFFDYKLSLMLGIPAVLGSIVGARFAISLPDEIFNKILAAIMLMVLAVILFQPHKRFVSVQENLSSKRKAAAVIAFFFVGIYGGFIQAGVGFIIIATLSVLTGLSLVKINSLKVFIVAIYTLSSLLVFLISGNVNLILGLILAVGNGIGAWLGSNFAVAKGDKWIRVILAISVIAMAAKLMGAFSMLGL